ncbi:MAG: hypothetical protein KDK65_00090 [Chlamydiia bacterium]|nr:hypothetical protein [Chlamydiia bacterium]
MFIIVASLYPLIWPHVAIYRDSEQFVRQLSLDRDVGNIYGVVLDRLYRREYPIEQLLGGMFIEIDESLLRQAGVKLPFPWRGGYWFEANLFKEGEGKSVYAMQVRFTFVPPGEPISQQYSSKQQTYIYPFLLIRETLSDQEA